MISAEKRRPLMAGSAFSPFKALRNHRSLTVHGNPLLVYEIKKMATRWRQVRMFKAKGVRESATLDSHSYRVLEHLEVPPTLLK